MENRYGLHIYRYSLPLGIDFTQDISGIIDTKSVEVIFDIGANIGQMARRYLRDYPNASVYCFEPVESTWAKLSDIANGWPTVKTFNLAMAESEGIKTMHTYENSSINSFVNKSDGDSMAESVMTTTVDKFCEDEGIDHINLMKIDVEGYELEVLKGADKMLRNSKVDMLYVETELRNSHRPLVPFLSIDNILQEYGFEIFAVYDQIRDQKANNKGLHFCNVAYIRRDLAV